MIHRPPNSEETMPDNASHVAVPTDRDAGQAGKLKLTTVYRNGSTLAGYREGYGQTIQNGEAVAAHDVLTMVSEKAVPDGQRTERPSAKKGKLQSLSGLR